MRLRTRVRMNSSMPGLGKPSELTSVCSSSFLATRGFGFPGQGESVNVPATMYPNPSLARLFDVPPRLVIPGG